MSIFHRNVILAVLLFLICFSVGNWLSLRRPLWNDEIYTQDRIIENVSYGKILSGRFAEGNNSPLFYLLQKTFCRLTGYHFPLKWNKEWLLSEPRSQFLLRLPSNLYMCLALVAVFWFFTRSYSLAAGFYSFFLGLSSATVWLYWIEARPYGLWVFLSTLQCLFFLEIIAEKIPSALKLRRLAVIHVLLSLTAIVSAVQIVGVSCLIFLFKEKDLRKYWGLTVLPVGICLFYLLQAPIVGYGLQQVFPLIAVYIPWERWVIFGLYVGIFFYWKKISSQERRGGTLSSGMIFLGLVLLFVGAAFFQMFVIKCKASGPWAAMQVPDRVFVYLFPAGMTATALFSVELWRFYQNNLWMRINLGILLGGFLVVRFLQTTDFILALNLY